MKPDEIQLIQVIRQGAIPRVAVNQIGIAPKRAAYLFQKWCRKGWYDYGVCADLGWLTPKAPGGDNAEPAA